MILWIDSRDKLPDLGVPVLAIDRYGGARTKGTVVQVSRVKTWNHYWVDRLSVLGHRSPPRYTHWTPLPDFPSDGWVF